MSETLSTKGNPGQLPAVLFLGIPVSLLALLVVLAYLRTNSLPYSQAHLREFLFDAKTLIAAMTAVLASVGTFFKIITNLRKEWENMRHKNRLERVAFVARKRSIVVPMLLAVVLLTAGSGILVGRAVVSETGKPIGNVTKFSVDEHYTPSGKMGDVGDITVGEQDGGVRFVYRTAGNGPHMWEWRYDSEGKESPLPAQFAGVMYLDPRWNWGSDPEGGYDLRTCHSAIRWEARSIDGPVQVKFVFGGDKHDLPTKERKKFQFPNSIDQSLGTKKLDSKWQSFEFPLSTIPDDHFKRVVGGFGWVISWSSNGVNLNKDGTGAEQPKTFTIEVRNVRYEKL